MHHNRLILVYLLTLACACGDDNNDSIASTELTGTWQRCHVDDEDDSEKRVLVFTANSAVRTDSSYGEGSAANCTGTPLLTRVYTSTYTIPGAADAPADAKKIDLTVQSIVFTPLTQDAVTYATAICPEQTWTVNTPVDMTGKSCGGSLHIPTQGTVLSDIFKIEGQSVYFGVDSDDVTTNRPSTLDTVPFTRM